MHSWHWFRVSCISFAVHCLHTMLQLHLLCWQMQASIDGISFNSYTHRQCHCKLLIMWFGVTIQSWSGAWVWLLVIISCTGLSLYFLHLFLFKFCEEILYVLLLTVSGLLSDDQLTFVIDTLALSNNVSSTVHLVPSHLHLWCYCRFAKYMHARIKFMRLILASQLLTKIF